jgi:hypothetical protein
MPLSNGLQSLLTFQFGPQRPLLDTQIRKYRGFVNFVFPGSALVEHRSLCPVFCPDGPDIASKENTYVLSSGNPRRSAEYLGCCR